MESLGLDQALLERLLNNDILLGLLGSSVLLGALYSLRSIPARIGHLLKFHFTIHISIRNNSESFFWIMEWIAQTPYLKRSRRLRLVDRHGPSSVSDEDSEIGVWTLTADQGAHWFFHDGRLIHLSHDVNEESSKGQELMETITLTTIGRCAKPLVKIVDEAVALAKSRKDGNPTFVWEGNYWRKIGSKQPRHLDTVWMPAATKQNLLQDIQWFLTSPDFYTRRGIPYRRGYLLSGPPGTGKTSLIVALSGHVKRPLYVLNIGSLEDDQSLFNAYWSIPGHAIVVLEDIDAIQHNRETDGGQEEESSVTLSGLLNILDGITSPDNQITMLTTNYPERLDSAMLRPGRADKHIRLSALDDEAIREMYKCFYEGRTIPPGKLSPITGAELQKIFMEHENPASAANRILCHGTS